MWGGEWCFESAVPAVAGTVVESEEGNNPK
jgi:hypothetical protein